MTNKEASPSLLWITPCNRHSAIGRYSALVTNELAKRGVRVTIGSCDIEPLGPKDIHKFSVETLLDPDKIAERLPFFDQVVYNVGNYYPYHAGLFPLMDKRPGILIFHDLYIYDLFYAYLNHHGLLNSHDAIVRELYGVDVPLAIEDPNTGISMLEHRHTHFPMLRWLAPSALGIVSHASFGISLLQRLSGCPIAHIPLAYGIEKPRGTKGGKRSCHDKVILTTFGDVNPNKRIESVIQAISIDGAIRDRLCYRLVGGVSPQEAARLSALAKKLKVDLDIIGRADDATYAAYLHDTDIVSCLRYPTTESASATAIEALLAGKPTLVSDIGFYRDLPDDAVLKTDLNSEIVSLYRKLYLCVTDENRRLEIGQRAAKWANDNFAPQKYADMFVSLMTEVNQSQPLVDVALHISRTARILKLAGDSPHLDRWTRHAEALFERY